MSGPRAFDFVLLGAGGRGQLSAKWISEHPDCGRIVAVAEPDEGRRRKIASMFNIPADRCLSSWEQVVAQPKIGDVVLNMLMDRLHAPSAIPLLDKGYHMMLEKPMATTLEDCIAIDAAQRRNRAIVSVCHSLRYHRMYQEVYRLVRSGAIGQIISFDQLEAVEPDHQVHSFVRGNWANESRSTFMLLAKSCHDIDILAWLVGRPCERVSSFGSLTYYRPEHAPAGATLRCTDGCPVEPTCKHSAIKMYLENTDYWMSSYINLKGETYLERRASLHQSPYGRCAWHCDNDVVDHQVVAFEFAGGITGTFTMTSFFDPCSRFLRLHGTLGQLEASLYNNHIRVKRFSDNAESLTVIPIQKGGHGGGDTNIMVNFIQALRANDPGAVLTSTTQSLETHRIVFAAEMARREKRLVEIGPLQAPNSLVPERVPQ